MIHPLYHAMPRVAFFIEPKWAFGSIHYALSKEFYKRGIYADVISWEQDWSDTEKQSISNIYDVFVSTPYGISILNKIWKVPLEKCVAILHSKWDANFFDFNHNQLKGLGSITPQIIRDKFSSLTLPMFDKILNNVLENQTLAELRDTLLPKLMSGEIRVKDAERALEAAV